MEFGLHSWRFLFVYSSIFLVGSVLSCNLIHFDHNYMFKFSLGLSSKWHRVHIKALYVYDEVPDKS